MFNNIGNKELVKSIKKRKLFMGFKANENERDKIAKFCQENDITKSELIRLALRKFMNNF